jgi:hypothetical protein
VWGGPVILTLDPLWAERAKQSEKRERGRKREGEIVVILIHLKKMQPCIAWILEEMGDLFLLTNLFFGITMP